MFEISFYVKTVILNMKFLLILSFVENGLTKDYDIKFYLQRVTKKFFF